ncbi:hypothetical protein [Streptomyces sp. NPDC091371]|uniref:hypothetical protein n=1 Tax=Streptomyces sp. NPDC091371 TaxID=3155303 RepID=UPI003422526C
MATSSGAGGLLGFLESKKNLAGCACGVAGVGLALTGAAGAWWPVVVAGLYGAGALIAPPERAAAPVFDPDAELDVLRADFGLLREYLAGVDLPPAAGDRLTGLLGFYEALLDPGWVAKVLAADPESVYAVSRAVRQDVPECVDTYNRTRWWARLTPGGESPERQLERQLDLLHEEAERLTADLREAEAGRQQSHTNYLEERGQRS